METKKYNVIDSVPLIELILSLGYRSILVVEFLGEIQYWSVVEFDPATLGSDPVNFTTVRGVNISEFIEMNKKHTDSKSLSSMYDKFIEGKSITITKLQPSIKWQCFTK